MALETPLARRDPHPTVGPDGEMIQPPFTAYSALVTLASVVVSMLVGLGVTTFSLKAHDNVETAQLGDLWNPGPFWRFLAAHILTGIVLFIGFICLIVPGIILAVGLAFVPYLVVERGLGPVEAMKESWRITKGHKWKLFQLGLVFLGICLLGIIAFIVGIFVALPVLAIAGAHAYRTLTA
jgi:uncharacterized membrane protein